MNTNTPNLIEPNATGWGTLKVVEGNLDNLSPYHTETGKILFRVIDNAVLDALWRPMDGRDLDPMHTTVANELHRATLKAELVAADILDGLGRGEHDVTPNRHVVFELPLLEALWLERYCRIHDTAFMIGFHAVEEAVRSLCFTDLWVEFKMFWGQSPVIEHTDVG